MSANAKLKTGIGMTAVIIIGLVGGTVAAQSVAVAIAPDGQTVTVRAADANESLYPTPNTAQYSITGSFDPNSLKTTEHEPVNAAWTCTCTRKEFIPPAGVTPIPPSPGDPTVTIAAKNPNQNDGKWSAKVHSPYAGLWRLTFKVTVVYDKKKIPTQQIEGKFPACKGTGICTFATTTKPWRVQIMANSIVVRRAANPQQKTVPFKEVTAKLIDAEEDKTVTISSVGAGELRFGMAKNAPDVLNTNQPSLSLTIPKDGTAKFYVSGEKESEAMGDTSIIATSTGADPQNVGTKQMTILWVDNITLKKEGKISDDNDKRNTYYRIGLPKTYDLGWRSYQDRWGWGIEIRGEVRPANFSRGVFFTRSSDGFFEINEPGFPISTIPNNKHDDTSDAEALDTISPFIFDFDNPGVPYGNMTVGTVAKKRVNYQMYAAFGEARCSDILYYYHRLSVERVTGLDANGKPKWIRVNVPNENILDTGTTTLEP